MHEQQLKKRAVRNVYQRVDDLAKELGISRQSCGSFPPGRSRVTLNVHYSLLFALHPTRGTVKLYSTYQTTVRGVNWFKCVGIGGLFDEYLLKPSFGTGMAERKVLHLAAYMPATVKDHVPGCGTSLSLSLRNDGTLREKYDDPVVAQLERHFRVYNLFTQQLLWSMADVAGVKTLDFQKNLELFKSRILQIRRDWEIEREEREREFRA